MGHQGKGSNSRSTNRSKAKCPHGFLPEECAICNTEREDLIEGYNPAVDLGGPTALPSSKRGSNKGLGRVRKIRPPTNPFREV